VKPFMQIRLNRTPEVRCALAALGAAWVAISADAVEVAPTLRINAAQVAGGQVWFKVVNPAEQAVDVRLAVDGGFKAAHAVLKVVAPDDLKARNTLDHRDVVRVVDGKVLLDGNTVSFVLPRWSAGVLTLQK